MGEALQCEVPETGSIFQDFCISQALPHTHTSKTWEALQIFDVHRFGQSDKAQERKKWITGDAESFHYSHSHANINSGESDRFWGLPPWEGGLSALQDRSQGWY